MLHQGIPWVRWASKRGGEVMVWEAPELPAWKVCWVGGAKDIEAIAEVDVQRLSKPMDCPDKCGVEGVVYWRFHIRVSVSSIGEEEASIEEGLEWAKEPLSSPSASCLPVLTGKTDDRVTAPYCP